MCASSLTVIAGFLLLVGPSCTNSDNLALLLDTLRLEQQSACADHRVSLACPAGTAISILVAQYGDTPPPGHECEALVDRACRLPNKLQYTLLQRVVEACQRKPSCQFDTNPGKDDPCPSYRKFVEVSYKCRPSDFRSLSACHGEVVTLSCTPHSRVAVYDVLYGRDVDDDVTCPQPQGVPDEGCSTPYAVETVMRLCHGKRTCQVAANSHTFGRSPTCSSYNIRPYAKVIYACVPLGVLIEQYESQDENGDSGKNDGTGITDEGLYGGNAGERWREPYTTPPLADPAMPSQGETTTVQNLGKKLNRPTNKENDDVKNYEFFVYMSVGIITFVIIMLVTVAVRCYFTRKAKENAKNGEMFSPEAPNVFNDASSDVDNDVEVSHISGTFYDPVHPDMILYRDVDGTRNTLRAMRPLSTIYPSAGPRMYGTVDYVPPQPREFGQFTRSRSKEEPQPESMTSPKSLGAYSTSQFYYG